MYHFVAGGSASGKSNRIFNDCISAAKADKGSHFLLIAPEQSTTAIEKELVSLCGAADQIDVLGFNRLAYRIFDELGIENPRVLDDISKAMILRKIGAEHEQELTAWAGRFDKPGFVDNLKSMLSELVQYGITPEELGTDPAFGTRLNNKLHDLKLIYTQFKKEIENRYVTAEEIPDILAKNIDKSETVRNSVIILDGFTGFTPIQYRIIEKFLACAKEVIVTVSIGEDTDNPLFDMPREMMRKINRLAEQNGVTHSQDVKLESDRFLEKHILRYDGAAADDDYVRIAHAGNVNDESAFIAAEIQKLVKTKGFRYRDAAVVCSDISEYGKILTHELELAGVPSYMDETIGIADNPLVMMINAALDVVSSDYSYESVARYLKTGMVSGNEDMINVLDNYIYECGKRGYRRMRDQWDYMPEDLKDIDSRELNEFKDGVLDALEELHGFAKNASCSEIAGAVRKLIEVNNAGEKLEAMCEEFREAHDEVRVREYEKVFEKVTELLDNMAALLQNEKLSIQEFADIFTAGAEQVKLGVLPSGADRVIIGDLTRSRLENVKVLFVAGANEGQIPKLLNRGSVITDAEKERLKAAGFELAPTAKEDLFIQRYYLYRVFTKAEKQLVLSYTNPSYIIGHLKKLYPKLSEEECVSGKEIFDINSAIRKLSEKLREIRVHGTEKADAEFESLYAYMLGSEENAKRIELITSAALYAYRHSKLSKESIDLLYGDTMYGSVSKLEAFAKCPYSYFATYGLKLNDIEPFAFRAVDIGNLSHAALEKIFVRAQRENVDLKSIGAAERDVLAEECIAQAILDDEAARYRDSAHNRYMVKRVERVVKRSLWGLLENLNDGFRPYAMELFFSERDGLKAAHLDLGGGKTMELQGKIDRTDIDTSRDGELAVRVIDYKTGKKTWDLNDVINGNDLQITMYMAAVSELLKRDFKDRTIVPEEMFYYTVQDPIIDRDALSAKATVEDALKKEMSLAGIRDREKIEALIPYVEDKAVGIGKRVIGGDVNVAPKYRNQNYSSCTYCAYKALCGFDRKIEGYRFTSDKKYEKDEQWQIISGQKNS